MIKMGDLLGATTKCLVQTGQAMINRRTALPVPIDLAKLFESRPEPLHDFDETEELEVVAPQITMLLDNLSVGPLACPVEIRD
jgi:hypothetical protein